MTTIKEFFRTESWQKFRDLTRPEKCHVGGVCAALGGATPFAAWMWRALFCAVALAWGIGIVAYIILWLSIPGEEKGKA